MTAAIGQHSQLAFVPHWAETTNANLGSLGNMGAVNTNVTFPSSPNPSFGGRWVQNNEATPGASPADLTIIGGYTNHGYYDAPDTTKRWSMHFAFVWMQDAVPDVTARIWTNATASNGAPIDQPAIAILEDTSGHLALRAIPDGNYENVYTDTAFGTYATPTATELFCTLDCVLVSGGTALSTHHYVLRVWTLGAGGSAPTLRDTIHHYGATVASPGPCHRIPYNAGTGRTIRFAHFVTMVEDADNPAGVTRAAWYQPQADGAENAANWSLTTTANWADVPPDGSTSVRSNTNASAKATSTIAAGSGVTAPASGDYVCGICVMAAADAWQGGKGGSSNLMAMVCDGNTAHEIVGVGAIGNVSYFVVLSTGFHLRPDGAAQLAQADLATLEIGVQGTTTGTGAAQRVTSLQGFVAWVKSGETLTAVPGPDVLPGQRPRGGIV